MRLSILAISALILGLSSTSLGATPDDTHQGSTATSDHAPARGKVVRKGSSAKRPATKKQASGTKHAPAPQASAPAPQPAPANGPSAQPAPGAQQAPASSNQPFQGPSGNPIPVSRSVPGQGSPQMKGPALDRSGVVNRVPTPASGSFRSTGTSSGSSSFLSSGPRETVSGHSSAMLSQRSFQPASVHEAMSGSSRVRSIPAVHSYSAVPRAHVVAHRSYAVHHAAAAHHWYAHRAWAARHSWRPYSHARWYGRFGWHPWRPWYARPYGWHPWYRPSPIWWHGVFIYGPPPARVHYVYVDGRPEPAPDAVLPERQVERTGQLSVGPRLGSYLGVYEHTIGTPTGFGDFGMGVAARYRAADALGLEIAWQYHDQTWSSGSERMTQPISATMQVFGYPWTRVNPYLILGVALTGRNYEDTFYNGIEMVTVSKEDALFGPTGGLGLEFGVGDNASINFEGRVLGYMNVGGPDPTVPVAGLLSTGFNLYF